MWRRLLDGCVANGTELDELFDALADQRRRTVLSCLGESEVPLALADVADEVASREHDGSMTDLSDEAVRQVYLSLYHAHVPKLADANLVEYDPVGDVVALAAHARPLGEQVDRLTV